MEAASGALGGERTSLGRLAGVGALAVVLAVVANLVVRTLAVSFFASPEFPPLAVGPTVLFTAVGVLGATVVFGLIARFSGRPVRLFRRVALVVLLLSLVPDVLLLVAAPFPGTSVPAVLALMVEHVVAWAISVYALTTLAVRR
jgi:hypothetical protein